MKGVYRVIRRRLTRNALSRVLGPNLANRIGDVVARMESRNRVGPSRDVFAHYHFVLQEPFGNAAPQPSPRTINWFIPPVGRGSGGHLNIFRFIANLESLGWTCRIVVCDDPAPTRADALRAEIRAWFVELDAQVWYHPQMAIPDAEVSVATSWPTAYPVQAFQGTRRRFYFVQDFEPSFYPAGTDYILAEQTYRMPFTAVTAGGWLAETLSERYGMPAHPVGFSYDKGRYEKLNRPEGDSRRVFFYARPVTPRRAFELGLLVLKRVLDRLPDVQVVLAGWHTAEYHIPFPHLDAGTLDLDELPDLYSKCDAALVISTTNLSLLPLELMACGCPVVSNDGPNVEWLLTADNAVLAPAGVEPLADAMVRVLEDPELRARVIEGGYRTAHATDWLEEARRMDAILRSETP